MTDRVSRFAQVRLGEGRYTATVEFLDEVLDIDRSAIKMRLDTTKIQLGLTGYTAYRDLSEIESEYIELHQALTEARMACETSDPHVFSQVDQSFSKEPDNKFSSHRGDIIEQVNSTFDELERTRQTISNKQQEAITRMSVAVSVLILSVSLLSLVTSIII
jgi:hypothetical protein